MKFHCVKCVRARNFSGPYFPTFELNLALRFNINTVPEGGYCFYKYCCIVLAFKAAVFSLKMFNTKVSFFYRNSLGRVLHGSV